MAKKLFNKYLTAVFLSVLLFAIVIKVYSVLTFPDITDWNYQELRKIDHNKTDFSFAVFGDNKNSITTFNSLIDNLNRDDVLFAIDCGDLVNDGEKEKYHFFINQIENSKKPLLTVIGNHDIREQGRANYDVLFGKAYYSFTVGSSYFIVLDDANEKNLDAWQLDWLKQELQKSQKYSNRFVFMHIPLYDPREGEYKKGHSLEDLNFAGGLNKLFDNYHITMLFVSHIHGYYKGIWGKTPYIITGGGGAELASSDPNHYFYHYIKVSIVGDNVEYKVVKLKSPGFELIDRWVHNAWIYVYSFFAIHFIDMLLLLAVVYLSVYIIFVKKEWLVWNIKKNIH